MIPGSNLLNTALTVIAKQTVFYYRSLSRVQNDVGQWVTTYATGIKLQGSFQAIPKNLYQAYGLDLQKTYFTFYTSNPVKDVARDTSPDIITYKGDRYQCESNNDWYKIDGWRGVLCVLLNPGSDTPPFGFNATPLVNNNQNFNKGNFSA